MNDGLQREVFSIVKADDEHVRENDDDLDEDEEGYGITDLAVEGPLQHLQRSGDVDDTDDCFLDGEAHYLNALHGSHERKVFLVSGFRTSAELLLRS